MKIIITGVTGFVGSEVLRQAIKRPEVTSIIALSRKQPDVTNAKLTTIIMEDFTEYPDSVLSELSGASGCIWALGIASIETVISTSITRSMSTEEYRKVNVAFATAAVNAFAASLTPQRNGDKFRFAYVSGFTAERDQDKSLWFGSAGEVENNMLQAANYYPDKLETFIARPAAIIREDNQVGNWLLGSTYSIRVNVLAAALLDNIINGASNQIQDCASLVEQGQKFLKS